MLVQPDLGEPTKESNIQFSGYSDAINSSESLGKQKPEPRIDDFPALAFPATKIQFISSANDWNEFVYDAYSHLNPNPSP